MQRRIIKAAGAVLAAGILLTSAVTSYMPQSRSENMNMGSMVVYAGENDFSWKNYEKNDASWWTGSEAISIADEIVAYSLTAT